MASSAITRPLPIELDAPAGASAYSAGGVLNLNWVVDWVVVDLDTE